MDEKRVILDQNHHFLPVHLESWARGRPETPWTTTKGLRGRMGRTPAENAEGAEVLERGKWSYIGTVFSNCLGLLIRKRHVLTIFRKELGVVMVWT